MQENVTLFIFRYTRLRRRSGSAKEHLLLRPGPE